ncbi:MAG: hypothetical protein JWM34_1100 [Ilumatobacteraceae bacterium]|nr:hypothetical protein [Ilumatobacteraceae bacterium]
MSHHAEVNDRDLDPLDDSVVMVVAEWLIVQRRIRRSRNVPALRNPSVDRPLVQSAVEVTHWSCWTSLDMWFMPI